MKSEIVKDIKKVFRPQLLIVLLLPLLLFLLLRWNSFTMPFERDEGDYAYSAWILSKGITPYVHSFLQKPPMIIYTYLLAYFINPIALWPVRLLMFISLIFSVLTLSLIIYIRHGKREALISLYFNFVMLTFPVIYPFAANTENFLLLPLILFYLMYVIGSQKTNQKYFWLLAGVFSSISILYKPIVIPVELFIFGVWIVNNFKTINNRLIIFRDALYLLFGIFITVFLSFIYFFIKGGIHEIIEYSIIFNGYYSTQWGISPRYFIMNIIPFIRYWWMLFIPSIYFVFSNIKYKFEYLGIVLIILASVYVSPIAHYYLLLIPFWGLIISISINDLWNKYQNRSKKSIGNGGLILIVVIFLVFMIWPFREQFLLTPAELNIWEYGSSQPFSEAGIVASKISKITSDNDLIFVAGSESEVYYYSKRLSPTRFILVAPLSMKTQKRDEYQNLAIKELSENPPKLIVLVNKISTGFLVEDDATKFNNYIFDLLKNDYRISGGYVINNGKGVWLDKLLDEDIKNSSFIIYEKI